jgi:hypothetical protein
MLQITVNPPYGGNEKADVKNYFPADLASSETADLFLDVMMYRLKPGGRAAVVLPDGFLFFAPLVNWGRYREENGSLLMPVTVRLNHAIADGYLVANVFRLLQKEMDCFVRRSRLMTDKTVLTGSDCRRATEELPETWSPDQA